MRDRHPSVLAGAPPPVVRFFLGRIFDWVGIVSACALPVAVLTWANFTPAERFGEILGALVWAVAMVIVGEQLRWPSQMDDRSLRGALQILIWNRWASREADRRSHLLRSGALVISLVYVGLAVFTGPLGLFLWFGPTVWIGSHLPLLARSSSGFGNAFWWTVACGAQTAVAAWLCGRGIDVARRAFHR